MAKAYFKRFVFFLSCMLPCVPVRVYAESAYSLAVSISVAQNVVKPTDPIMLRIVLSNTSDHAVDYVLTTAGPLFMLYVTDTRGNLSQETEAGRRAHTWIQGRGTHPVSINSLRKTIGAHQQDISDEDLRRHYVLSLPGEYKVSVKMQDPEHRERFIESNLLTLFVIK